MKNGGLTMDINSLKSLVGKDVTVATNSGNELWIFIENNIELRISNNTNAWRFIKNNEIILSSADFYIPMYDAYDDNPFSPVYDSETYQFNEDTEWDDSLEEYYDDLEAYREERFRAIKDKLEYAKIAEVESNEIGDFSITLSNEIILQVFKTLYTNKKNYKILSD